jgi:hypothetical protein
MMVNEAGSLELFYQEPPKLVGTNKSRKTIAEIIEEV